MDRSVGDSRNCPDKIIVALAGLIAGILFAYKRVPLFYFALTAAALMFPAFKKNRAFFYALLLLSAGFFTACLHMRIPANHISSADIGEITGISGKVLRVQQSFFETSCIIKAAGYTLKNKTAHKTSGKVLLSCGKQKFLRPGSFVEATETGLQRIPPPANPGGFDRREFLGRKGIFVEGKAEEITVKSPCKNRLSLFFLSVRRFLEKRIERRLMYYPEEKALLETIAVGKPQIPHFLREAGVRSGTYHLLVISGLHLGFLLLFARIFFIPLKTVNNRHPLLFPWFCLFLLWLYAGITGFRAPVVRAALMLSFFYIGQIADWNINGLRSIALAAIVLLFLNPSNLFDSSFQLSFAATAGILFAVKRYRLPAGRNVTRGIVLISLAAHISVAPLLIGRFGVIYPIGLITNILFFPLAGLIVLSFPLFLLLPFLSVLLRPLLSTFLYASTLFAQISPGIHAAVPAPAVFFMYALLFLLFAEMPFKKKTPALLAALFAAAAFLLVRPLKQAGDDKVYFLSLNKPAAVFVNSRKAVCFLPDNLRQRELENVLLPFFRAKKTACIEGLFYNNISYNLAGTLKSLMGNIKVGNVFEHASVQDGPFYPYLNESFYTGAGTCFCFNETGGLIHISEGMTVEILGEEEQNLVYIAAKGDNRILIAPYVGSRISEKLRGRKFDVAYIGNMRNTAKVARDMNTADYKYLVLPRDLKKFAGLKAPGVKTFYIDKGAVEADFSSSLLSADYYRDTLRPSRVSAKRTFIEKFFYPASSGKAR